MASGAALANEHMATQVQAASVIQAGLGEVFDKQLNIDALDASFPTYLRAALALVTVGHNNSLALAEQYYGKARSNAGYDAVLPLLARPKVDIPTVAQDLLMSGPVAIKTYLKNGNNLNYAVQAAKKKTLHAGKRHVLNAGRGHLIGMVKSDKDAIGWARVSDGQPCHFCAMLIGRGPDTYKSRDTATFKAHNGCGCSVRCVFEGEADGGWSPEARAINAMWEDNEGMSLNEWRKMFTESVNDPSSALFRAYTDKVAVHLSSPAVVEARKNASAAFEMQKKLQREAQEKAKAAATKAAQEAAEKEAKEAAKQAALIKKWRGKAAPKKPVEPKMPAKVGAKAFDDWLEKVKKRYHDFAVSTGNYKTDLTTSYNWHYVQDVINKHDIAALNQLRQMKYIDNALWDEATDCMVAADQLLPGAQEAYKKALQSFKRRSKTYEKNLADWREVNGIVAHLDGMDGAVRHTDDWRAIDWANEHLPVAKERSRARGALKRYTGSDYGPWNRALREAGGELDPDSPWASATKAADKGFEPLKESMIVHRGTGPHEFGIDYDTDPTTLKGTVYKQPGYASTAVGNSVPPSFRGKFHLAIRVPEGHGVSWVAPFSHYGTLEREVLLQRGTQFFIHDVYQTPTGQWIVEAEALSPDVDPSDFIGMPTSPSSQRFE